MLNASTPPQPVAPAARYAMQQETDSRSVYVGNVDYTTAPQELAEFFAQYGSVNRITILHDRFTGRPKGYAYVEFLSSDSVEPAIEGSNGGMFKERELRVIAKRTNVPGMAKRGKKGKKEVEACETSEVTDAPSV